MNDEPTPEDVVGNRTDDEDLMTVVEVAEYFRVNQTMVRRWLKQEKLPGAFRMIGPVGWRIPRASVRALREEFAEQRQIKSTNEHYLNRKKRGTIR
jgi:excisionase family DNA binding protein